VVVVEAGGWVVVVGAASVEVVVVVVGSVVASVVGSAGGASVDSVRDVGSVGGRVTAEGPTGHPPVMGGAVPDAGPGVGSGLGAGATTSACAVSALRRAARVASSCFSVTPSPAIVSWSCCSSDDAAATLVPRSFAWDADAPATPVAMPPTAIDVTTTVFSLKNMPLVLPLPDHTESVEPTT
jgi:hypothetical protein